MQLTFCKLEKLPFNYTYAKHIQTYVRAYDAVISYKKVKVNRQTPMLLDICLCLECFL